MLLGHKISKIGCATLIHGFDTRSMDATYNPSELVPKLNNLAGSDPVQSVLNFAFLLLLRFLNIKLHLGLGGSYI